MPLTPAFHPGEPLRSLLLRTAVLLGLDLRLLCEQVGEFDGDPRRWPALQVNRIGAERAASLLAADHECLAALVPELANANDSGITPRLSRRPLPRPWFASGAASCSDCLSERDGAERKEWQDPWTLVCLDHARPLRPGYLDSLAGVTEVVEAQRDLTALAIASPDRVSAAAPIVWDLVARRAHRGHLHELAVDRMQRAAPHLRRNPVLPMPPVSLMLLPEIVRALERAVLNWPIWLAADGRGSRMMETEALRLDG